jgi:hypothetical protein
VGNIAFSYPLSSFSISGSIIIIIIIFFIIFFIIITITITTTTTSAPCSLLIIRPPAPRSMAVRAPRQLLQQFGMHVPSTTRIITHDSTAEMRYMVLPMRPEVLFIHDSFSLKFPKPLFFRLAGYRGLDRRTVAEPSDA